MPIIFNFICFILMELGAFGGFGGLEFAEFFGVGWGKWLIC
jgi:hypothetical protein